MVRLIGAIVLVLVLVTPTLGQQSLVGTYKLISLDVRVDGKPYEPMGKAPHGYLVITLFLYVRKQKIRYLSK